MQISLNRRNSILTALAAAAIGVAGCNSAAPEKSSAAVKPQSGKAATKAESAAKRLQAEPADSPEAVAAADKSKPEENAPAAQAEPAQLADKNAPAMPAAGALAAAVPGAGQAPAAPEIGQVDPLDLIMPTVMMTEQEAKTCQMKVGDTLPDMKLPKAEGGEEALKDLYGQRLTVVVFWKATQPYAVEELGDLQRLVAGPFADKQVKVVGVDVQDERQVVQETVTAKKLTYPNLIDTTGTAFAQVADGLMPRTYLVDPQGKILWLDMEYSRSTRRDLLRAIRATLSVND